MIERLHATFGRLEDATLELQPGLNVISGSNEAGKSTWAEFLMAMLYGVDTRARGRGGELPVKTKYAPWSGRPMEGSLEAEWNGRKLLVERISGQAPMGGLRVLDRQTGCPVEELQGQNPGEALTGVEESVYERSGFIRQRQSGVTPDPRLEQRLSRLVTAGSEDYAYRELDDRLKKLQNAVWYNQSGQLPQTQEALLQTEQAISVLQKQQEELTRLQLARKQAQAEETELTEISEGLRRLEQAAMYEALEDGRHALRQAVEDREGWEAVCSELPPQGVLDGLKSRLQTLRERAQTAATEESLDPIRLPELPAEEVFAGLDGGQAKARAEKDAALVRQAEAPAPPSRGRLWLILGILALALGAGGYFLLSMPFAWIAAGVLGCGGIGLLVFGFWTIVRHRRERRELQRQAEAILAKYKTDSPAGILAKAASYAQRWVIARDGQLQAKQQLALRAARAEQLSRDRQTLLDDFVPWLPDCEDLSRAEAFLQSAADSRRALEQARRTELLRAGMVDRLSQRIGAAPARVEDLSRFRGYDAAEIQNRLKRCRSQAEALGSDADRLAGAMGSAGRMLELEAEKQALEKKLQRLKTRYTALLLARKTLEQADNELRSRFAPLLCEKAGALFSRLTEGAYDRVRLDRALQVAVHPAGSAVDRPLSYLSGGAVEQLYLALRLAVCELLLPQAPIVLDDALVFFDDKRAKQALSVLKELGKTRQILLFTCQSREKRLLDELAAEQKK